MILSYHFPKRIIVNILFSSTTNSRRESYVYFSALCPLCSSLTLYVKWLIKSWPLPTLKRFEMCPVFFQLIFPLYNLMVSFLEYWHHWLIIQILSSWQYEKGWLEYSNKSFTGRFIADSMVLLKRPVSDSESYRGKYQTANRFEFQNMPVTTKQGELFG